MKWLALALALALGAPLRAELPGDIKEKKQDLRQIQKQIRQTQADLNGQQLKERSLLKELDQNKRTLDARRRDVAVFRKNLGIVEGRLQELSRSAAACQAEIDLQRSMLQVELVALYKSGPLGSVKLLLSSRDPSELISRYHYLGAMARHSTERVKLTRERLAKLAELRSENLALEGEENSNKKGAEQASRRAALEKRRRESLLGSVRLKKSRAQSLLKELAASASQLQDLVSRLQEEAKRRVPRHVSGALDQGPSRLGRHHSLPWPVRGRVISRFGEQMHPLFKTTVFNRGIEIAAPLGSAVMAVADGTVRFADDFEGYGQMVILDHGGGDFTVYGYNSALSVKEGDTVAQGQPIAEVGDSFTLKRSALYFEIRRLAKAEDPSLWLR